jgi:hypothetical protein
MRIEMKLRRRRWIIGIAVLCLVLLGAVSWAGRRRVYRTVDDTKMLLVVAGISPGIPAPRLLAILDSLRVEHSELGSDGVVGARMGRSFEDFMIHGDIHADFRFDSTGRLASQAVREVLTGP